ncbi:hypothetical protein LZ32DRAFT_375858 [Colletotrichum eremochloae]|nr:hypothetical protein LZ32DRAFT_375858 [Colletotrichum eremochloae]
MSFSHRLPLQGKIVPCRCIVLLLLPDSPSIVAFDEPVVRSNTMDCPLLTPRLDAVDGRLSAIAFATPVGRLILSRPVTFPGVPSYPPISGHIFPPLAPCLVLSVRPRSRCACCYRSCRLRCRACLSMSLALADRSFSVTKSRPLKSPSCSQTPACVHE